MTSRNPSLLLYPLSSPQYELRWKEIRRLGATASVERRLVRTILVRVPLRRAAEATNQSMTRRSTADTAPVSSSQAHQGDKGYGAAYGDGYGGNERYTDEGAPVSDPVAHPFRPPFLTTLPPFAATRRRAGRCYGSASESSLCSSQLVLLSEESLAVVRAAGTTRPSLQATLLARARAVRLPRQLDPLAELSFQQ